MSLTSATDLLLGLWANDQTRIALLLLGAAAFLFLFLPGGKKAAQKRNAQQAEKRLPTLGRSSLLHRLQHRPEKPVRIAGVTFDRAWRHIAVVATTGARKSTLLAMLAEQLDMPCIIITGDHAPPLENWVYSVGGWLWRARGGIGWYPWGGPLELAVQRAEFMHPSTSGDVGVGRAMFKQAARVAWQAADDRGELRTLAQLREALPAVVKGQTSAMMAENWTARLKELEDSLGSSLGDELDIVEALRNRISVMVSLNSFQDVANRKRFASIAVLEALRAADTLGNIALIFDEVGLIGADLFEDAVRVLRVRLCTGLFASQLFDDFPAPVRDNIGVYFLGQQSGAARSSRQLSSETTFGLIPPEHFGSHVLPHGKFFIVHDGHVEQLNIPTWQPRHMHMPIPLPIPVSRITDTQNKKVTGSAGPDDTQERVAERASGPLVYGPPEMPEYWGGDEQLINIWLHHTFPDGLNGCYESTYRLTNRGRPTCSYKNQQWSTYILSKALADGMDLAEVRMLTSAGKLTVDHLEHCQNKTCDRADHLGWEDRGENTRLHFERVRGVGTAAD